MNTAPFRRLRGLLRKELLQILRDPSSLAIAFLLPAVLLLIFGDGVSLDARNVPLALVVERPDTLTASFTGQFEHSPFFRPHRFRTIQAAERPSPLPLAAEPQVRFNPAVNSRNYLVPGLIAVIMTLTGALLTALVIAREWERGTMEALMVTRVTMREILIAKLIPYFLLGMGGMAASVAIAVFLFEVPLRGSLAVLTGASALFMLAALGMGLLISSFARNQFVAGQIAIITTFLPAFILSGFVFDINSMPRAVQIITHIVAARYFVSILQSVFLAGDVWSVILPNAAALAVMAAIFLGAARIIARKRLD
jgi:ABC-2 type transport system permease protein